MSNVNATSDQQAAALVAASTKYNVPLGILVGVYGMESAFGSNVATSSAGAEGAFQFLKSTAGEYGYPYTNQVNAATFQQQADGAAKYLASLFKSTQTKAQPKGSWDQALKAYSGGGYGLADVSNKASSGFTDIGLAGSLNNLVGSNGWQQIGGLIGSGASAAANATGLPQAANAVSSAAGDVGNVLSSIWGFLTTPAKWLVVLKFVGGAVLVFLALKSLAGINMPAVVPV